MNKKLQKKNIRFMVSIILILVLAMGITPTASAATKVKTEDERVWGQTAYDTALEVADELYRKQGKFDNVLVATGGGFWDALSGGYYAKVKKAPILLVTNSYEDKVITKIKSIMKPGGTVYVLGGYKAVRDEFLTKLKNAGLTHKRVWGQTALDTNLEILKDCVKQGDTLLVATTNTFYDSLSGSSVGLPIMIVKDGGITDAQRKFIADYKIKKFAILGGTSAVKPVVETQLKALGSVERVWGQTAVDTSYEIAKRFYPNAGKITIVTSLKYYDGLSGAPLAMYYNAPILLVNDNGWKPAHNFVVEKKIRKDVTIGGTSAVTAKTVSNIMTWYEDTHTHTYGEPTWTWTGYTKAVAKFTCSSNDDTKEVNAAITSKVTKEATTNSTGTKEHTATVSYNGKTYTNVKTETIPKKSHVHNIEKAWTADNDTHFHICIGCEEKFDIGKHVRYAPEEQAAYVSIYPTPTQEGLIYVDCKICNTRYSQVVPKLNHDHVWSKTYYTSGVLGHYQICTICGIQKTPNMEKHSYKKVYDYVYDVSDSLAPVDLKEDEDIVSKQIACTVENGVYTPCKSWEEAEEFFDKNGYIGTMTYTALCTRCTICGHERELLGK